MKSEYDYIIVGAGSSGCVLADELSKNPQNSVLVVEYGPPDTSPIIDMPRGVAKLMDPNSPYNICYEVQKGGNKGPEFWNKGTTLGGSSSINGMIYARGHDWSYNSWEAAGAKGWGWKDVLPHFIAMENHEMGASNERGSGGPLNISMLSRKCDGHELCDAILSACEEAGTPWVDDPNAAHSGGIGYTASTTWKGKRQSASKAFLREAAKRPNLDIITETRVLQVIFGGKRATSIKIRNNNGTNIVKSNKEIILSAGAIESPKLLQLSGIGDAKNLRKLGIEVVKNMPQVGKNLREHYYIQTKHKVTTGSLNDKFQGLGLVQSLLKYFLFSTGPLTHPAQELIGYAKSREGLENPDIQLGIGLYSMGVGPRGLELDKEPGMTIGGYYMHPKSLGEINITTNDADVNPNVVSNKLTHNDDIEGAISMIKYIRKITSQPALKKYYIEEVNPGPAVVTDEEILNDFLERSGTAYHVCGTCRMGVDEDAVVEPNGKVVGLDGIRVCDTSIFPFLNMANTNMPAMMAGRKIAQMILAGA